VKSIYLAGPITGLPRGNRRAFSTAARHLRALGYYVVDPRAQNGGRTIPRDLAMGWDVRSVVTVDALVFLPGWRHSVGARLEYAVASEVGTPCYEYDQERGVGRRIRDGVETTLSRGAGRMAAAS